jgi:hypothetical protein
VTLPEQCCDAHHWRQNSETRRPTKCAVTDKSDLMGAYYHYDQNNFGAGPPCNSAAKATCSGTFDAVSFNVDWRFAAKFDAFAGLMFSQVNINGLANGHPNRSTIDPRSDFASNSK